MLGNKEGLTLIEVIIALLILSICIIPVYTGLVVGSMNMESSERRMIALQLAQGKLEETFSLNYKNINSRETKVSFPDPYSEYDYTVIVTKDDTLPTLKIISVTVYYSETGTGTDKNVVITGTRGKR